MRHELLTFLKRLLKGGSLPVSILSRNPPVLAAYWEDFVACAPEALATVAGRRRADFLFQFGWHRETPERAAEVEADAMRLLAACPHARFTFLCNSPREAELAAARGLTALFCHQNAFLDERRYPLSPRVPAFDAIYIARVTPFKRHSLAAQIPRLKLVGDYTERERSHFEGVIATLPQAAWERKVVASRVSRTVAEAAAGLCLSAEEGAMFVSAEYLLSGRPLVSTPNLGGRDHLFSPETCVMVEPTPEAVAEGVREAAGRRLAPAAVRGAVLARMAPHRAVMANLLQGIFDEAGAGRDATREWPRIFLHKLGLRCSVGPVTQFTRILRRSTRFP